MSWCRTSNGARQLPSVEVTTVVHEVQRGLWIVWLAAFSWATPANADWFTLSGKTGSPDTDYVEVDPANIQNAGDRRILQMRVNRSRTVIDADSFPYRSMTAQVSIDCASRSARIIEKAYFAEPNFVGPPLHRRFYGPSTGPSLQFDGAESGHAARLIKAACG